VRSPINSEATRPAGESWCGANTKPFLSRRNAKRISTNRTTQNTRLAVRGFGDAPALTEFTERRRTKRKGNLRNVGRTIAQPTAKQRYVRIKSNLERISAPVARFDSKCARRKKTHQLYHLSVPAHLPTPRAPCDVPAVVVCALSSPQKMPRIEIRKMEIGKSNLKTWLRRLTALSFSVSWAYPCVDLKLFKHSRAVSSSDIRLPSCSIK
jgi:hypothetical protein